MILKERQSKIIKIKKEHTSNIKFLAKKYASEATIRRDLRELHYLGLIKRSHGRAILPNNTNMDLSFKSVATTNLQTALQLTKKENVRLIFIKENIGYDAISTTDSWTVRQTTEFSFDLMLLPFTAIMDEEVYERSLEKREIKLTAMQRSKKKNITCRLFKVSQKSRTQICKFRRLRLCYHRNLLKIYTTNHAFFRIRGF